MSKNKVVELFGLSIATARGVDWRRAVRKQWCPFLLRTCLKRRKSEPEVAIGTCSVRYGSDQKHIVICPIRLLEGNQVFADCLQLLTLHSPGNELHVVPELSVPGGSVDYCLVSARSGKVEDFVGIELQTLDTRGTVWPERQRLLKEKGVSVPRKDAESARGFGINWKITAKTTLVQLHHKTTTFEHISKHLVLVLQDHLLDYMRREFTFDQFQRARLGDPVHVHAYRVEQAGDRFRLELANRISTDAQGIAACLGLQANPKVELDVIVAQLERKLSDNTRFSVSSASPPPSAQIPKN
jgi:hypothetical protein